MTFAKAIMKKFMEIEILTSGKAVKKITTSETWNW